MGSAVDCVDVVGKGVDRFVVGAGPLHGDFDLEACILPLNIDRLGMDRFLLLGQLLDKRGNASLVLERALHAGSFVLQGDFQSTIQIGEFAKSV